ncbi:MFS transporter [Natrialbaceae archaeon A-CW3]
MAEDDHVKVYEAATEFLETHANGEEALETVLHVDSEHETWTFDDVPLDSGVFGELVSRGIIEKTGGEYRVVTDDSVAAALAGDELEAVTGGGGGIFDRDDWSIEVNLGVWGDVRALAGLVGALALVFVMRITQYRSVFRGDDVVSPGNDPYHYRYWMEQLLAKSNSPTDIGMLASMPEGATGRRPLTHALNWWFATLLGGDQAAADLVAAWLPVVASIALGVLIYGLAVVVTRDVRIGIASVVLFAVAPVHVVYTQVGFLEHRLHQYFWLGVVLLLLAWLAVDVTRRREDVGTRAAIRGHLLSPVTWLCAVLLGLAFGISIHLWGGSPLLFIPLAVYIGLRAALDAREGISPTLANLPTVVGLGIGAALSAWLYLNWGWQMGFVAFTPAMVFGGALAVFLLADLWRVLDIHVSGLVALEGIVAAVGVYVFREYRPEDWAEAQERMDDLMLREGYTESVSLFTPDYIVIFGPLIQLGVSFYLGIAVMGWAIWLLTRRYEPVWLLLSVYTVVLMILAAVQVRFAAQLMIPLSVLGGVGFVHFLSWLDLAGQPLPFRDESDRPVVADGGNRSISFPDRQRVAYIFVIGLLVCSLSVLYAPGLSGQTTYSDSKYEAMQAINEHAMEIDREYPENFVLSHWGDNRMYNYFVSGESRSYLYAMSNFDDFRFGSDADSQYDQLEGRVGYVVLTELERDISVDDTQRQLLGELDTGGDGEPLEHYRLLYVDENYSTVAFAVVSGATINATGDPGDFVTVRTEVSVKGETFVYERDAEFGVNGVLEVTVPYAGEYSVGDRQVTVTEDDVVDGNVVRPED